MKTTSKTIEVLVGPDGQTRVETKGLQRQQLSGSKPLSRSGTGDFEQQRANCRIPCHGRSHKCGAGHL